MQHLQLLGPVSVRRLPDKQEGVVVGEGTKQPIEEVPRFRSRLTVALLGYLVSERRPVGRGHLAALFWPDKPLAQGRANLRRELHNLARILPDCWQYDRQAVGFAPSSSTVVDLDRLRQLEEQERWEEAAELLGGEYLEGLYLEDNPAFEEWLLGEQERWRGITCSLLKRVITGYTRRGRYTEALQQARHLLQLAPWDEETHRRTMRLLAWMGQRGEALRQYLFCQETLRELLDVEPDSETTALYQEILSGKLDLPPQLPAFLTGERARHAFESGIFVGRESQLAQLDTFLHGVVNGEGRVIFISGGPGRGKTALSEAFVQQAMDRYPGLLAVKGQCNAYGSLGDPYVPFRDVMAMLAGDIEGRWDAGAISTKHARRLWASFSFIVKVLLDHGPNLFDVFVPASELLSRATAVGPENAPWLAQLREQVRRLASGSEIVEQNQLFHQFTKVLCTISLEKPLLLILDDVQWADTASISLLFHLGRRLFDAESRLLIACAYRPEEVALGRDGGRHPLEKLLNEFKRTQGDVWVDLGRSNEREERRFVDILLDAEPNSLGCEFRDALYDRTGGHPLFTVELLRTMQDRGDLLRADEDGGRWIEGPELNWDLLPARVEAVIEGRIEQLDPVLQDLLAAASVEGEVFTAQVLADVQHLQERPILSLLSQELERRHRLVREQEETYIGTRRVSRYRFSHVLFRDYLYKQLGQGERRLLHLEVALALERLFEGRHGEIAVQLAQHFRQARDHPQAFHYSILAGERAAHLYDSGEAIAHYTQAISLAESVSTDEISLARLHRGRGLAYGTLGQFEEACADHERALQLGGAVGQEQVKCRALLDLGRLWASRDYDRAQSCFQSALDLARRLGEQELLADSLNWLGNWRANDDNPAEAVAYHQEALAIFEALGNRRELANTLDLIALAYLLGGDLSTSVHYYDQAIGLFQELDDRPRQTSSLIGRATTVSALAWMSSLPSTTPPDARLDFEQALRMAAEIASAADQAWGYYSLGMLYTVWGQYGESLAAIQRSYQIASEIGHREYLVGARFALGLLYAELFASAQACQQLEEALVMARELRSRTWIHIIIGVLARVYLNLNHLGSAHSLLEDVNAPGLAMDTLGKRYCWIVLSEMALQQDDPFHSLEITERLIASAAGMKPGQVITYLWKLKAEAMMAIGHMEEASTLLRAAIENAQFSGERFLLWRLYAVLGRLSLSMGHRASSDEAFNKARALVKELGASLPQETLQRAFHQGADTILEPPS